jgi:hypothetical protein
LKGVLRWFKVHRTVMYYTQFLIRKRNLVSRCGQSGAHAVASTQFTVQTECLVTHSLNEIALLFTRVKADTTGDVMILLQIGYDVSGGGKVLCAAKCMLRKCLPFVL